LLKHRGRKVGFPEGKFIQQGQLLKKRHYCPLEESQAILKTRNFIELSKGDRNVKTS
jgi:hypothetical protein